MHRGITCHVAASLAMVTLLKSVVLVGATSSRTEVGGESTLDSFRHCV